MRYGIEESLHGLSAECTAGVVGDGATHHHGQWGAAGTSKMSFDGIQGGFGIEGVENGLYQKGVDLSLHQCGYLFAVGFDQFVEMNTPESGVVYVRTDTRGFVGGPNRTRHETRFVGFFCSKFVGQLSGYLRRGQVEFVAELFHAIVGHRYPLGIEGVGFGDIGACLEIGSVYVFYDGRLGEAE